MTSRERQLEELLTALVNLLADMERCPTCIVQPNAEGTCRKFHEQPYKQLRARIRRELSRKDAPS